MGTVELLSLSIDALVLIIIGSFLRVFISRLNKCLPRDIYIGENKLTDYRICELEKELKALREDFRALHVK